MIALGLALVILTVHILIDGLLLVKLWEWFAVPIFHLPTLTISQAIGVTLVVSFLTHQGPTHDDRDQIEQLGGMAGWMIFRPLLFLLIAAIVRGFMP